MKKVVLGMVAGLALLAFSTAAHAQYRSPYNSGYYNQPYVQPQYSQFGYVPNNCDPYANSGAYLNYSAPSFGLGIYSGQGYRSGLNIYSGPSYGQSYSPGYFGNGWGNQNRHHHHHHR